jgi:hypothetical protein
MEGWEMTAETDLPPLPDPDYLMPQGQGWPDIPAWSENTVRQIVAHHTAPLQAENEALREQLRLSTVDQVNAEAEANDARAEIETLREALEEILSRSCMNLAMNPNPYELTALLGDIHQIAGAALAQEGEQ